MMWTNLKLQVAAAMRLMVAATSGSGTPVGQARAAAARSASPLRSAPTLLSSGSGRRYAEERSGSCADPNLPATKLVEESLRNDPNIYPPPEVRARLFFDKPVTPQYERLRTRAWTKVKTGS